MISRISPFIVEVALGIVIGMLMGNNFSLESIYEWLKNNNGNILSIYAILITVSAGPFKNLCQSGKITNTQGNTDEYRNRCRAICS